MMDGDTCEITCNQGFKDVGFLTCKAGMFVGIVNCFPADMDLSNLVEVAMVSSAIGLAMDISALSAAEAEAALKGALASGLGLSSADIAALAVTLDSRRLAAGKASRRLDAHQAGYEVSYQAVVPDGQDSGQLAAKAGAVGAPGDTQSAFLDGFPPTVTVDQESLKVTQAPRTFSATIVRSEDGSVLAPAPPPMPTLPPVDDPTPVPTPPPPTGTGTGGAPAPKAKEEEEGSGAMIGGIIGAIVGVIVLGGIGFFVMTKMKKKGSE
jgi:hypothetical protein